MFPQSKPDFQVFRACPSDPRGTEVQRYRGIQSLSLGSRYRAGYGQTNVGWVFRACPSRFLGFQSLSLIGANPEELALRACLFSGTASDLE